MGVGVDYIDYKFYRVMRLLEYERLCAKFSSIARIMGDMVDGLCRYCGFSLKVFIPNQIKIISSISTNHNYVRTNKKSFQDLIESTFNKMEDRFG